jgi:hypothetical protein
MTRLSKPNKQFPELDTALWKRSRHANPCNYTLLLTVPQGSLKSLITPLSIIPYPHVMRILSPNTVLPKPRKPNPLRQKPFDIKMFCTACCPLE